MRTSREVWYAIVLLAVVNVFNYMDRMALAILAPSIKQDLELSDGQLGLLTGFAFAVFYAVCAIPIARWADRGVRRNIIALALATWSVMTALSGAAKNFWHLFIARVGVGAGEAGCVPAAHSLLCDYVSAERRPLALAINSLGLAAGIIFGMGLAGWLGERIGWRWTFVALGLPGLALALIVRFTLREPQRGRFDPVKDKEPTLPLSHTLKALGQCKTYRLLVLYNTTLGFAAYGLMQWWPSFFVRVHGLDLQSVGAQLGVATGTGYAIGLLVGGLMGNKAAERTPRLPLLAAAAAVTLSVPAALASLMLSTPLAATFCVFLAMLCISVAGGPVMANTYSVVAPPMRATAGAVGLFFQSVLGFGLGPFCVGVLSDALAPTLGSHSLRYALLAPICMIPLMAIMLYAASRTLRHDLNRA